MADADAMQNDWSDGREGAYDHDGDTPSWWTPEHVQSRLIDAFEVLATVVGRVSPDGVRNNWPAITPEFSDVVDPDAFKNLVERFYSAPSRPTPEQVEMMEEALAWPMKYLRGYPMQADAITLFCMARSEDGFISALLRGRVAAAKKLIPDLVKSNSRRRCLLARDAASWANARIARLTPSQRYRVEYIKENARIRLERAVKKEGGLRVKIKPSDVMPGKIMSRTHLDYSRKIAAAKIAAELNKMRVAVR